MNKIDPESVCRKYGSKIFPAPADSMVGIALATLSREPLRGVRVQPHGSVCGWYIFGGDYSSDPSFFDAVHVEHLKQILPEVLPYLLLEPGFRFIISRAGYEDVWYEDDHKDQQNPATETDASHNKNY